MDPGKEGPLEPARTDTRVSLPAPPAENQAFWRFSCGDTGVSRASLRLSGAGAPPWLRIATSPLDPPRPALALSQSLFL